MQDSWVGWPEEDALGGVVAAFGSVEGGVVVGRRGLQVRNLDWRLACMHMGNELPRMAISILGCSCIGIPSGRDCLVLCVGSEQLVSWGPLTFATRPSKVFAVFPSLLLGRTGTATEPHLF